MGRLDFTYYPTKKFQFKSYEPLSYDRYSYDQGDTININSHSLLKSKLDNSDSVYIKLSFQKIGDALLSLGGIKAIFDYLEITNLKKEVYYEGDNFDIMSSIFHSLKMATKTLTFENVFVISNIKDSEADISLLPEILPVWADLISGEYFSPLPQRYYLYIEQLLNTILKKDIFHSLSEIKIIHNTQSKLDKFHISFINCSSLIERKGFSLDNFYKIALLIQERLSVSTDIYIINGNKNQNDFEIKEQGSEYFNSHYMVYGGTLFQNSLLLSESKIIIGNDTGLTHLSAMSSCKNNIPKVIGIYNRHGFTKWITGFDNHFAVGNYFSTIMSEYDLCPVRDELDERLFPHTSINDIKIQSILEILNSTLAI